MLQGLRSDSYHFCKGCLACSGAILVCWVPRRQN